MTALNILINLINILASQLTISKRFSFLRFKSLFLHHIKENIHNNKIVTDYTKLETKKHYSRSEFLKLFFKVHLGWLYTIKFLAERFLLLYSICMQITAVIYTCKNLASCKSAFLKKSVPCCNLARNRATFYFPARFQQVFGRKCDCGQQQK